MSEKSFHKHNKKLIFLPQEADTVKWRHLPSISLSLPLHWCSEVPPVMGERKSTIKKVRVLKELIIKMPDHLGEVNKLHGGKEALLNIRHWVSQDWRQKKWKCLQWKVPSSCFRTYECHSVELWIILGQNYRTPSAVMWPLISICLSQYHMQNFGVSFHLQFITTKISYLHRSIFSIAKWVIVVNLDYWNEGFQHHLMLFSCNNLSHAGLQTGLRPPFAPVLIIINLKM